MKQDVDSIIRDLMDAGFIEYEAKVYLSLLQAHPASAYTISQNSGVPHSRVYDICRRLKKKGYAVSTGTNPETFSPLSPDELIDKIQRDNDTLTRKLNNSLHSISFSSDFDPVWNIQSREEALSKTREIIAQAKTSIYIGLWSEEFELLREELRKADQRGVDVFMLIYGHIDVDFGEAYFHDRDHLEDIFDQGRSIDLAADREICLSGILGEPGKTEMVWTRNIGLVHSIEGYIIHDFYLAELVEVMGNQVMVEHFGKNLSKLRDKFNRRH
ncbi:TrmB family transcriptional regulator [Salinispira pacifica]|uniref:Transcriptional regulator, TrmB family n=1 Tax=Salinispira pacifica TaxID=1307761 RepID=V5WF65_9SPIO|nr:helix-turn-helix domain-containing protein [Salinispira pacifica]AHC14443.1 Transcriptional regulator, TrmB family [Salinispira pacifica]